MTDDCYYTHVSEIVRLPRVSGGYSEVCPCCKDHKQLDTSETGVNIRGKDCKNVFWDGFIIDERGNRVIKSVGQCCCWSDEHE